MPYIEQEINGRAVRLTNGAGEEGEEGGGGEGGVDFVMTDLHPHIRAWEAAVKQRENLHFVPGAVDAADLSTHRLGHVLLRARDRQHHHHPKKEKKKNNNNNTGEKVFRLFHLAFHHFPDPLARRILQNTIAASDGFAIFELQGRDLGSLFTICAMGPFLMLGSWYWFWGNWELLFWTYVVPVVPFVVVFDGVVSALRTRREGEVMALVREAVEGESGGVEGWRFETGSEVHTWPVGRMNYFIGVKEGGR